MIATRFDGTAEGVNLVPQDANLNRGAWKRMENEWARALQEGKQVKVDIKLEYFTQNGKRPDVFTVRYWIKDELVKGSSKIKQEAR